MFLHNHLIDKLAVVSGLVSGIALYPQIYEIIVNSVQNTLSPLTLYLIFFNNIVWFVYGIHRQLISLVIAAFLTITASGILLVI
jgi:uncharacterized protein with PQ loop repeat